MRKDAQGAVLLIVGAMALKISFSGTYLRYVRPGMVAVLVGTGIAVMLVGAVALRQVVLAARAAWRAGDGRSAAPRPDTGGSAIAPPADDPAPTAGPATADPGAADPGTADPASAATDPTSAAVAPIDASPVDESTVDGFMVDTGRAGPAITGMATGAPAEPRAGWLLLAAAVGIVLLSPPALGSFPASRGTAVLAAVSGPADLPPGDPVRLSLREFVIRAGSAGGRSLVGRRVTLTGFVVAGADGGHSLARLTVSCCAADARPVRVGLAGDLIAGLVADEWVEVDGVLSPHTDRDPLSRAAIPYLEVVAVRPVPAPAIPYEG